MRDADGALYFAGGYFGEKRKERIDIFSTVLTRFRNINTGFSSSGITTGRIELLQYYLQLFLENPVKFIIGNGIGIGYSYRPPHNTIIDFLDIMGLIGTFLFSALLIKIYKLTPTEGKGTAFILLVPLMYFFLSMFYSIDFCFELALIYCFSRQGIITERC